jgi:hypothetical protein
MDNDKKRPDGKTHTIRMETRLTLGADTHTVNIDKRRAAIKAALHSATAGLAATASGLASEVVRFGQQDGDGGTPPWGEVIIEPIWYEKNPQFGHVLVEAAELQFWE